MAVSLAVKYRPKTFDDVIEQDNIKIILEQQLKTGEIKNSYLFVGGAGTGKTTCARILANEINKGQGNPIELDAASNNSVDDVRDIIQQAKTKSLDSEYKIFIIDECHALSNSAWQAMLKLIEEPPAKSIFIFCTTNPERIPKTILSRVQRYDFKMISQNGIGQRLCDVLSNEFGADVAYFINDFSPIDYIAKLCDGHMRDALTMLDKCLAYSKDLTMENVVKALGVADYEVMIAITDSVLQNNAGYIVEKIEEIYSSGIDLKQFIKQYLNFIVDVNKYMICGNLDYTQIPKIDSNTKWLDSLGDWDFNELQSLLDLLVNLNAEIKWDTNPKYIIEARFMQCVGQSDK